MLTILVRGTGDVGSAVAHALFRAGHRVVLHDARWPAHARRGMAFTDAIFDGSAELEGVLAKRARDVPDVVSMLGCGRAIPVADAPVAGIFDQVMPQVLVDARMRKRDRPEPQRGLAPLTIGLGPNFVVDDNVDVVIETAWGEHLGEVINHGGTLPLSGEPRPIEGHSRERFVHAPSAGTFRTRFAIGDHVLTGQPVASIGEFLLCAPISGSLRGLAHDGALIVAGAKVVEVDPRDDPAYARGIGDRPRQIAAGVLRAISERALDPD